jgi:membrane protein required for colicin V production
VSGAIDRVKLNEFDRQLGALLGLGKGVLRCIAVTFFAVTLLPQAQKENIVASRAGRYIVRLLDKTDAIVPPEIHEVIHPYLHKIEERLDPNYQPHLPYQDLRSLWREVPAQAWPQTSPLEPRPFPPPYTAEQPGRSY